MSSNQFSAAGSSTEERVRNHGDTRSWPTWTTAEKQGEDAIVSAITDLFWFSAREAIDKALSLSLEIATRSNIKLTSLSKSSATLKLLAGPQPKDPEAFNPAEDEKAFRHISRCLLQAIGLFDSSVLLEYRGDILGTGVSTVDWILSRPNLRFATQNTLHWGNAHGSIVYGPLRFETGVKTDDSLVDGILVTCRFNSREKRPAVRLAPRTSRTDASRFRMDITNLRTIPIGTECRIPALSPFAMVKQVIDGIFLQANNKDPLSEAILDSFVASALKYQYAKSVQRLGYAKLEQARLENVQKTTDLIRYQGNGAYDGLVRARVRSFVSLMITKPGLATWNSVFRNCQHFCASVLESQCFVRQIGYDSFIGSNTYAFSLPSIRKVFRLADDQNTELSPWFSEYFSSVERLKGRTTMLSFRTADVGEQPRTSLLDLRKFGIPALPNRIDHTQTNDRLGVKAGNSADAWFSLSAISLFFVAPHDALLEEIAGKVATTVSVENAMGMLALGYLEWLEKVAQYHLLDSISLSCYASLTHRELEAISKPETFRGLLDETEARIGHARAEREKAYLPWKKRQLDKKMKRLLRKQGELGAIWDLEVAIPMVRTAKRGQWDWFKTLG